MASRADTGDGIVETIKTIVYALLIAGVFRTLFFQPFWIPSGSMKDTLLIGDFLFVNKMAYGYSRYSCPFGLCPFSGRILFTPTQARRRRGVPPPGQRIGFHQAADRPAGRPDPDQGRSALHQRRGGASDAPAASSTRPMRRRARVGHYPRCENAPVGEGGDLHQDRATSRPCRTASPTTS